MLSDAVRPDRRKILDAVKRKQARDRIGLSVFRASIQGDANRVRKCRVIQDIACPPEIEAIDDGFHPAAPVGQYWATCGDTFEQGARQATEGRVGSADNVES